MIKTNCYKCGKTKYKSPSKVCKRNFCSSSCYASIRNKELVNSGEPTRYFTGNPRPKEWTAKQSLKITGEKNVNWKGDCVGYRGLHQWIRRKCGKPIKCDCCGKVDTRPRFIQWANISGKYLRDMSDYIPLCGSCHKHYDLNKL